MDTASNIIQLDGNISDTSDVTIVSDDDQDQSNDSTDYETEDEAFSEAIPANFSPIQGQNVVLGQPLIFDINQSEPPSSLPLCLVLNARSVYNKSDNLREMLHQFGPDICIISESWERQRKRLHDELNSRQFKAISYFRKNRAPGGGAVII